MENMTHMESLKGLYVFSLEKGWLSRKEGRQSYVPSS